MRKLALVVLVACNRSSDHPAPPTPPPIVAVHDGSAAADPWSATPSARPDDPPSFAARHELADRVCPQVTAPYFFEIAKDGKVSHILGTRHIGVALAKFPAVVRDDLHAAKLVVFEVAPDDHGGGTRTPDIDMKAALGDADWKHYADLIGSETAGSMATGRPSSALLVMMVMYEDLGALLENQIQAQIEQDKIPARGLETSAFQDGVLDHLLDLRMLRATVEQTKDRAELEHDSTKDLRDYCAGVDHDPGMDAETRRKMLAAGYTTAELDAMDEELVYTRNRDWIPKLEPILAQGDVFIAVGADHLLGTRGVVSLLQARGYAVKRIAH